MGTHWPDSRRLPDTRHRPDIHRSDSLKRLDIHHPGSRRRRRGSRHRPDTLRGIRHLRRGSRRHHFGRSLRSTSIRPVQIRCKSKYLISPTKNRNDHLRPIATLMTTIAAAAVAARWRIAAATACHDRGAAIHGLCSACTFGKRFFHLPHDRAKCQNQNIVNGTK